MDRWINGWTDGKMGGGKDEWWVGGWTDWCEPRVDAGEIALEPGCYWFATPVGILTTPLPDAPFGNFILGGNQSSMAPGQSG